MWQQTFAQKRIFNDSSLYLTQMITKSATTMPFLLQLWQNWRQKECGWTPLDVAIDRMWLDTTVLSHHLTNLRFPCFFRSGLNLTKESRVKMIR
jgi:hypothetical protein